MKTVGEILKTLREEKNISMDEMVDQLKRYGVSPSKSMISRWENGKAEPSMEYARVLAQYFNVSLDFLIGLSDTKNPKKIETADLKDTDIITLAAHRSGHEGELSEEDMERIKLAIQIALAKNKK